MTKSNPKQPAIKKVRNPGRGGPGIPRKGVPTEWKCVLYQSRKAALQVACAETGADVGLAGHRMRKQGLAIEQAIIPEKRAPSAVAVEWGGTVYPQALLACEAAVAHHSVAPLSTVIARREAGWDIDTAASTPAIHTGWGQVYCMTHIGTGLRYVGTTKLNALAGRMSNHVRRANAMKSPVEGSLQHYLKRDGIGAFKVEVLESASPNALEREQYFIEKLGTFPSELNRSKGGEGGYGPGVPSTYRGADYRRFSDLAGAVLSEANSAQRLKFFTYIHALAVEGHVFEDAIAAGLALINEHSRSTVNHERVVLFKGKPNEMSFATERIACRELGVPEPTYRQRKKAMKGYWTLEQMFNQEPPPPRITQPAGSPLALDTRYKRKTVRRTPEAFQWPTPEVASNLGNP